LRSFHLLQLEIVEVSDGIGFGPEPDHPGVERLVAEIEDLLVVKEDVRVTASMGNPQCVPPPHVDRLVEVF
jgi:hypothetical protein